MKKIKLIMVAMLAFLATATFTACGSDDNDNNSYNVVRYQQAVDKEVNTTKNASKHDKALLLVAFGSTWQKAFDAFDNTIKAYKAKFPDYDVYLSFSSAICINRAEAGEHVGPRYFYAPNYWLHSFGKVQYKEIVVQSLQVIPGEEYGRVVNFIKDFGNNYNRDLDDKYLSEVKVYLGTPLMATTDDVQKLAVELNKLYKDKAANNAVLFMGHGNPDQYDTYSANIRYTQLEDSLQTINKNYYVGTVDMSKNFKTQVRQRMKANGITSGNFYLQALMSIAGDHAHNDMAGDDNDDSEYSKDSDTYTGEVDGTSWKNYFTHYNFTYQPTGNELDGLLDFESVRQLWINHTQDAIDGEPLDIYHSMNPE